MGSCVRRAQEFISHHKTAQDDMRPPRYAPRCSPDLIAWRKILCKAHQATRGNSSRISPQVFKRLQFHAEQMFDHYKCMPETGPNLCRAEMSQVIKHLYGQTVYIEKTIEDLTRADMARHGHYVGSKRATSESVPFGDDSDSENEINPYEVEAAVATYRQRKKEIDTSTFQVFDQDEDKSVSRTEWVYTFATREGIKRLQEGLQVAIMPL
eukprot:TRINITY_DN70194_c0_g1_i1.p1 TRINITY_DN70194_c0_g1~~TRINITY_DN70194_c0_g1_i1.p1  ORF type:complete len:243 (+),score=66.97 TRINITY_DN70194_c0_g1_i1:100-729(+)